MELAETQNGNITLTPKIRSLIIGASLLALFLGALDALVMSAAMPTIVADLGGMHLYSWAYATYFLARVIALPIFGKLADLFNTRRLFLISIGIFVVASAAAGAAVNMEMLVLFRVFQGIGAGGNFALVYTVLSDISPKETRGKTLSLASVVWGLSSVLGPTLGAFIVTWFSWRWIFLINIPLGGMSLLAIMFYMVEVREKKKAAPLDYKGALFLSTAILSLLYVFISGGREIPWVSWPMIGLLSGCAGSVVGFILSEKSAPEPILSLHFFTHRGFSMGNIATLLSSFAIFALFAYAPLYIQGVLQKPPMAVGWAMLSLSLGWSLGSMSMGQTIHRLGKKSVAVAGGILLAGGSFFTLFFSESTSLTVCLWVFLLIGLGMGFVTLSTLLVVQNAVSGADLGVATGTHQFFRTLGGTMGVGVCGGLVTSRLTLGIENLKASGVFDNPLFSNGLSHNRTDIFSKLLDADFQATLSVPTKSALQLTMMDSVMWMFYIVFAVGICCFIFSLALPGDPEKTG